MVAIVQEAGIRYMESVASRTARSVWDCGLSRFAGGHGLPSVWTHGGFWLALGPGQDESQARTVAHESHVSDFCDALCHSMLKGNLKH